MQQLQRHPPVPTASDRLVIRGLGAPTTGTPASRKARGNARHICDMQRCQGPCQGPIGTHGVTVQGKHSEAENNLGISSQNIHGGASQSELKPGSVGRWALANVWIN